MTYNARGLRASLSKTAPGQSQPSITQSFLYRGSQVGQVTVVGPGSTAFTETFLYRPDGAPLELLRQVAGQAGTQRYWYVVDKLGAVLALADSTGALVNRYYYDLWGGADPLNPDTETVPQPLRFAGYWDDSWYDGALGFYNFGPLHWYWLSTRCYDPLIHRFLQPDPSSQDGIRSYSYVHDDPVDLVDPSGLAGIGRDPVDGLPTKPPFGVEGSARAGSVEPVAQPANYQGEWPPLAPNGSKPPIGAPDAVAYRYQRYVYDRYQEGIAQEAILPLGKWVSRHYRPVENGGRPGRPGGSAQVAARTLLANEEGYINTEAVQLGSRAVNGELRPNMVDMYRSNSAGGIDYVEVDSLLQKGIPFAATRAKLRSELGALNEADTLTYVDKLDPSRRIVYYPGEDQSVVDTRIAP